jgi:HPt (histidine-containing phosphotransfer) domain-containing protein
VRALQAERRELEQQVESLKVLKGSLEPAKYEAELERLVTALALKTRELRQAEAAK